MSRKRTEGVGKDLMLRTGAQNGLNGEKKITLFLMKKNYKFSHSVFNSVKITLAFSSWLTWSCLRLLLNLENLIILKHGLAVTFSSLLLSAGFLLYIIFSKFVFENLNADQLSNVIFFPFCISDMATFQPFIQIVLEEPLYFQGIYLFIFIWYIFTKTSLHYSSWS